MGRVYLARSPGGRPVAFKVIRSDFTDDPDFRVRFAREVAAARSVSGVFTAPVLDADPHGDPPWLATGYVPGVALSDAVARFGPLPDALGQLAGGIAEALIAVHEAGLVHRDLKPANVMLAADGPRLIDFGIARALEGGTITRTGFLVGSPGFLAPEQAGSGQIGPATDVFALGSVLTYAATGTSPFGDGVFTELLFKVLYGEPEIGGVPERYRELVASMLAKDPGERPTPRRILERLAVLGLEGDGGGWLPRPLTELVVAQSAALLSQNPLAADAGDREAAPASGTGADTRRPGADAPDSAGAPEQPPAGPTEFGAGAYAGRARPGGTGAYAGQATSDQPAYGAGSFAGGGGPSADAATGRGTTRRGRRVAAAVLAVAAIGVAAALVVPGLLDDDKGGQGQNAAQPRDASTPPTAGASGGALPTGTAPNTACGAIDAAFTDGTPRTEFSPANTTVTPTTSAYGYTITAGPGSDARTDYQGNVTAPFSSVAVNGDFAIETRVTVDPRTSYQSAGLLLFANKDSYIRLERGFGSFNSIAFEYFLNGTHHKLTTPFTNEPGGVVRTEADTVTLRLERRDDVVTAQWRAADDALWEQLPGEAPFASKGARAGMTVLNTPNSGRFTATFSSFAVTCL
ncbi:DUF1349 domain-containing protein [Yinghuangia sp. ASG 101]|nr:DUF1349 domain-containing protein [Yinghuangia sp. ASG 101]